MRGRKKEPEGRRVPMTTKFSESEAAFIDALRGDMSRSEWLRRSALASIRQVQRAVAAMDAEAQQAAAPEES